MTTQGISITVDHFKQWREACRVLLNQSVAPEYVHWNQTLQSDLLGNDTLAELIRQPAKKDTKRFNVPQQFIDLAEVVSCHRNDQRWPILYRTLWRLVHGEKHLLRIATDQDILQLRTMEKQVRRDAHKMKAFVRFRTVVGEDNTYIAWHLPSHLIVERTAPFFCRRFGAMKWAILTLDRSAYWDGKQLKFGPGLPRSAAPKDDEMEDLWKTFYWHIFNPARLKVNMMKSEMPMKYWHTMPETALIPDMLNSASQRVIDMIEENKHNNN